MGSQCSAGCDRRSGQFDQKRAHSVAESHTRVQGCFSFHQLTLNPWPRTGFPLQLSKNSWSRIQCGRFRNVSQVAPPDPVRVSGRGGQAWNMEPWTSYIFFSICHLTFIWNLGFDLCNLNSFYCHIWTLLGSPFKPPVLVVVVTMLYLYPHPFFEPGLYRCPVKSPVLPYLSAGDLTFTAKLI